MKCGISTSCLYPMETKESLQTLTDMLYGMYLDCKHTGDFLYKRIQVKEILKRERREKAYAKKVTELGYHDR